MNERLINQLRRVSPELTDTEIDNGIKHFQLKTFEAKSQVLEIGQVCKHLYLPLSSVTRCWYKDNDGEDQTLWMKPEAGFLTEYKSYVTEQPSQFGLQFYENTEVYYIEKSKLEALYLSSSNWALFGIKVLEEVHVKLIDVFVNLLANDATSNYQYIAYAFPKFLQVAPLKDIASMLQMSQVSLSRIRAGKQTK